MRKLSVVIVILFAAVFILTACDLENGDIENDKVIEDFKVFDQDDYYSINIPAGWYVLYFDEWGVEYPEDYEDSEALLIPESHEEAAAVYIIREDWGSIMTETEFKNEMKAIEEDWPLELNVFMVDSYAHKMDGQPAHTFILEFSGYGYEFSELRSQDRAVLENEIIEKANFLISEMYEEEEALKMMLAMTFKGDKVFMIDYLALEKYFDELMPDVEMIIDSFKFKY